MAIVGASGCGKTVLLHILTGLLTPDAGLVLVADHHLEGAPLVDLSTLGASEEEDLRLASAVVFQKNALFSASVYENCAMWLEEHTRLNRKEIDRRVRKSLEAVSLDVDDVIDKDRDALSGGMAKRVAVARAIAQDPMVVFYDEPTTGLDPVTAVQIHDLIFRTHLRPVEGGGQRTTVLITHDRDLLRRLHPRVIMIHRGRVAFDGDYDAFSRAERGPAHEYLLAMPVLHGMSEPHDQGVPET